MLWSGQRLNEMNGKMKFSVLLFFSLLGLCVGSVFGAVELNEGEITTIKNMVEHDSGTGPAPAKQSEMIHEKSKVSTQAASMAELTFGVKLAPLSRRRQKPLLMLPGPYGATFCSLLCQ